MYGGAIHFHTFACFIILGREAGSSSIPAQLVEPALVEVKLRLISMGVKHGELDRSLVPLLCTKRGLVGKPPSKTLLQIFHRYPVITKSLVFHVHFHYPFLEE